ncbi:MAG: hypothetical protein M1822_002254 [Bathelium mastoideum]|nr:MAG: hypothetical protein M1822_002254 [Bathelium mastoideum]
MSQDNLFAEMSFLDDVKVEPPNAEDYDSALRRRVSSETIVSDATYEQFNSAGESDDSDYTPGPSKKKQKTIATRSGKGFIASQSPVDESGEALQSPSVSTGVQKATPTKLHIANRPKTRNIIRWTGERDIKLLLDIIDECEAQEIQLPWTGIAAHRGTKTATAVADKAATATKKKIDKKRESTKGKAATRAKAQKEHKQTRGWAKSKLQSVYVDEAVEPSNSTGVLLGGSLNGHDMNTAGLQQAQTSQNAASVETLATYPQATTAAVQETYAYPNPYAPANMFDPTHAPLTNRMDFGGHQYNLSDMADQTTAQPGYALLDNMPVGSEPAAYTQGWPNELSAMANPYVGDSFGVSPNDMGATYGQSSSFGQQLALQQGGGLSAQQVGNPNPQAYGAGSICAEQIALPTSLPQYWPAAQVQPGIGAGGNLPQEGASLLLEQHGGGEDSNSCVGIGWSTVNNGMGWAPINTPGGSRN